MEASRILQTLIHKGLGAGAHQDWNLLRGDLSFPCAVLYQDRLQQNLQWMQQFIAAYKLNLAPHGKTTMAPRLFSMQLNAGAWGITLATAHQTSIAYAHGVRRILMANQLVGKENMATISRLLADPEFEFYCLVDSPTLISQLADFFSAHNQRLHVLVELGVPGGRAGVRDQAQLDTLLVALTQHRNTIALSGVELYEGVLEDETSIREFLRRAVSVTRALLDEERFARTPALLSGAGSAWYDVVAEEFAAADFGGAVEIVLRPGCYLTHDVGAYRQAQQRIEAHNPVAHAMQSKLKAALQIWACVQSIPEDGRAIIGMGKRDAAFDAGLPVPALHYRAGQKQPTATPAHWTLTKMMDQHAYMQIAAGDDIRVGDILAFDISHPCLTFDKWRVLSVVNSNYDVVDQIKTYF